MLGLAHSSILGRPGYKLILPASKISSRSGHAGSQTVWRTSGCLSYTLQTEVCYCEMNLVRVNGNSFFLRKISMKEEMKQTINNSTQIIIPCMLQIIVFL